MDNPVDTTICMQCSTPRVSQLYAYKLAREAKILPQTHRESETARIQRALQQANLAQVAQASQTLGDIMDADDSGAKKKKM